MIKPIELTEKHKEMLLEMCRKLFPKFQNKCEIESKKWCEEKNENIKDYEIGFRLSEEISPVLYCSYPIDYDFHIHLLPNDKNPGIHWFEFCMNDLANKIYHTRFTNKQSENWFGSHYNWVCWALNTKKPNKIHIVDYLYEQFIKIKDNDIKEEKK